MRELDEFLNQALEQVLSKCTIQKVRMQGGGYINSAAVVGTNHGDFFIKWNDADFADMFIQEAKGLALLNSIEVIQAPKICGLGTVEDKSFLIQEYLQRGSASDSYWMQLGEALAAMHQLKAKTFGLDHDNYIGRLPQSNAVNDNWVSFYRQERLNAQLKLAMANGYVSNRFAHNFDLFLEKLPDLIPASEPSFLHGDLWNGNVMPGANGAAYFFDPAVYYGAREMDLAMTRLFGGFEPRFYEAYHAVYPLPDNFEDLADIYNLYPLMVHVNLLGPDAGYVSSVERIIERYL